MKKLIPISILVLLVLAVAVYAPAALAPLEQSAGRAQAANPGAPAAAATQAIATPLPALLTTTSAESALAGTSWIMSSLNGALPVADTTITLQLGADGSASGSDGCNRYWTTFEQDGENLTIRQPIAASMMACAKPVMAQASEYQDTLGTVTSFATSSRQLVLFAGNDIVLTYIADAQTLAGTAWNVVNYNNGRQAVVGLLEGTEITLTFDKTDLSGNAGCNNYFAGYELHQNNILIDPPGSSMMFCVEPEGVMAQESQYLAALAGATTFTIEGDQLWLRDADDAIAVIAVKDEIIDLPEPEPKTPTGTVVGATVLNIRSGPGTNFPVIGAARQGDTGTIVGRSQDGRWWVVDAPSLPGGRGWVSADFVAATDADDVPVIPSPPPPPPTPTPLPRPTAVPPTATPIPPTAVPSAQINFWADRTQINQGECATLFWDVQNVRAVWVYPRGADFNAFPRTGQGSERVCPAATTTYEMRVHLTDGSTQFRQLTINVTQPIAPPPPPTATTAPVTDPLAGTRWTVVSMYNGRGGVESLISGSTVTMDFDNSGQLRGGAGCNNYSTGYRVNGSSISIDQPASTGMFCDSPEGVMEQEQRFLSTLSAARTFDIQGNQLHVRLGSDVLGLVATRAP